MRATDVLYVCVCACVRGPQSKTCFSFLSLPLPQISFYAIVCLYAADRSHRSEDFNHRSRLRDFIRAKVIVSSASPFVARSLISNTPCFLSPFSTKHSSYSACVLDSAALMIGESRQRFLKSSSRHHADCIRTKPRFHARSLASSRLSRLGISGRSCLQFRRVGSCPKRLGYRKSKLQFEAFRPARVGT